MSVHTGRTYDQLRREIWRKDCGDRPLPAPYSHNERVLHVETMQALEAEISAARTDETKDAS